MKKVREAMKNKVLVLVAAVLALFAAQTANAQTRWDYCRPIVHGVVCVARAQRVTKITCDEGYQPQFGRVPRCVPLDVQFEWTLDDGA